MFEIETGLIFWTILSFGLLLILLYKFVFPPLVKVLEQRREAIEGGLKRAEQARTEAEDLLSKYRRQLGEAEQKTAAMFEEAKQQTEAYRDKNLRNARKEAMAVIEKTKDDIDIFRRRSMQRLKKDIADIVVEVNRKLIQKKLTQADHLKLVEASIKELEKNVKKQV
jgi:F-type H+-transporting ATPase subunit b